MTKNLLCVSTSAAARKRIAFTDILDFSTRNGNIGIQVVEPNGYEGGCWYYITLLNILHIQFQSRYSYDRTLTCSIPSGYCSIYGCMPSRSVLR